MHKAYGILYSGMQCNNTGIHTTLMTGWSIACYRYPFGEDEYIAVTDIDDRLVNSMLWVL